MIEAKKATLTYQDKDRTVHACKDVDLRVEDGEFLGILGPSGSGKSSLLYLLSSLKVPTSGTIAYQGRCFRDMNDDERAMLRLREFGFIFQHSHLIGYLTAVENILAAAPDIEAEAEAEELMGQLSILDLKHRMPHELSGGQRQRVCAARALIGGRRAIFADEPTAALDHTTGVQVVDILAEHRKAGSLVMVTHDETMLERADRVVHISDGTVIEA